jgi:hypothetical protein
MYGYTDSKDVTPGKQGGRFGLNIGKIVKFEYNPNAGASGAVGDAIDLTIKVEEKEYMMRFFPVNKVYSGNAEITDTTSQEYKDAFEKEVKLLNAYISDIVGIFVSEEDLRAALQNIPNFKTFAQIVERLVKSNQAWNTLPVDVFLQYQYAPTGENTRTFLELPKNIKQGKVICRSLGEGWVEDRTTTHLKYTKDGVEHPFKRGEFYLGKAWANPIVLASTDTATSSMASSGTGDTW